MTLLVALVVVVAVVWLWDARRYWRKPCRKCDGAGRFVSPLSKSASRPCPRCGGSGKRIRLGFMRRSE